MLLIITPSRQEQSTPAMIVKRSTTSMYRWKKGVVIEGEGEGEKKKKESRAVDFIVCEAQK